MCLCDIYCLYSYLPLKWAWWVPNKWWGRSQWSLSMTICLLPTSSSICREQHSHLNAESHENILCIFIYMHLHIHGQIVNVLKKILMATADSTDDRVCLVYTLLKCSSELNGTHAEWTMLQENNNDSFDLIFALFWRPPIWRFDQWGRFTLTVE